MRPDASPAAASPTRSGATGQRRQGPTSATGVSASVEDFVIPLAGYAIASFAGKLVVLIRREMNGRPRSAGLELQANRQTQRRTVGWQCVGEVAVFRGLSSCVLVVQHQ